MTQDPCFLHTECWQCVEDPCSRRQEAEELNNVCVWCPAFPGVGKACIPSGQERACSEPLLTYTSQCPDTTTAVSTQGKLCLASRSQFLLGFMREDRKYGVVHSFSFRPHTRPSGLRARPRRDRLREAIG